MKTKGLSIAQFSNVIGREKSTIYQAFKDHGDPRDDDKLIPCDKVLDLYRKIRGHATESDRLKAAQADKVEFDLERARKEWIHVNDLRGLGDVIGSHLNEATSKLKQQLRQRTAMDDRAYQIVDRVIYEFLEDVGNTDNINAT